MKLFISLLHFVFREKMIHLAAEKEHRFRGEILPDVPEIHIVTHGLDTHGEIRSIIAFVSVKSCHP